MPDFDQIRDRTRRATMSKLGDDCTVDGVVLRAIFSVSEAGGTLTDIRQDLRQTNLCVAASARGKVQRGNIVVRGADRFVVASVGVPREDGLYEFPLRGRS